MADVRGKVVYISYYGGTKKSIEQSYQKAEQLKQYLMDKDAGIECILHRNYSTIDEVYSVMSSVFHHADCLIFVGNSISPIIAKDRAYDEIVHFGNHIANGAYPPYKFVGAYVFDDLTKEELLGCCPWISPSFVASGDTGFEKIFQLVNSIDEERENYELSQLEKYTSQRVEYDEPFNEGYFFASTTMLNEEELSSKVCDYPYQVMDAIDVAFKEHNLGYLAVEIVVGFTRVFAKLRLLVDDLKKRTYTFKYIAKKIKLQLGSSAKARFVPLEGDELVGIEVSTSIGAIFHRVKNFFETKEFQDAKSPTTFALGKDIYGTLHIADLIDVRHVLATGEESMGKNLLMRTMLESFLFKATPFDLRFLLIDMDDNYLKQFNNAPHMLHDTICDSQDAIASLVWVLNEMQRRQKLFRQEGYSCIEEYNKHSKVGRVIKMPRIVVALYKYDKIDADIKMLNKLLIHLVENAHKVGIHLVMFASRYVYPENIVPLRNVVPTIVGFAQNLEWRSAAEIGIPDATELMDFGDMLCKLPTERYFKRLKTALVVNREIEDVVTFLRETNMVDCCFDDLGFEEETNRIKKGEPEPKIKISAEMIQALKEGMRHKHEPDFSFDIDFLSALFGWEYVRICFLHYSIKKLGVLIRDRKNPTRWKLDLTEEQLAKLIEENGGQ